MLFASVPRRKQTILPFEDAFLLVSIPIYLDIGLRRQIAKVAVEEEPLG